MKYMIRAACASDIGQRRNNNEDNFYFDGYVMAADSNGTEEILYQQKELKKIQDYAIFDGMGGHADGQIASLIAAGTFKKACERNSKPSKTFLKNIMFEMSEEVWKKAYEDRSNTGTTASVLRLDQDSFYVANVGDSPVFLFRDGEMEQISFDHTDDLYFINHSGAKRKPPLTQYIGINPEMLIISPFLLEGKIINGDRFLLSSDGLTDMISKEELAEIIFQHADVRNTVKSLIDRANEYGGRDNISAILIEVEELKNYDQTRVENVVLNEKKSSSGKEHYHTRMKWFICLAVGIIIIIAVWSYHEITKTTDLDSFHPSISEMT